MLRNRWLGIVVLASAMMMFSCSAAVATEPVAVSTSGLTIVPFAVPVAVPVAVVQRPTVFYGVANYATPVAIAPAATAASVATSVPPTSDEQLRSQVAPILERRCAECHRGSQAQGDLLLFDADSRLLEKLPRHLVVEQTTSADGKRPAMPPGERERLTADEQSLLRRWGKLPKRLSY